MSRGRGKKFFVHIRSAEGQRILDGGVGGMKDRRAAARVAFYWLLDNGLQRRPVATQLAAKLEDGESVEIPGLTITITEGA